MATELKTNTATRITVGPFLDKTDGITPEVALTATNEKLTLMVDTGGVPTLVLDANATASGGNNDLVHVTGDDAGYYDLELTAAQLNYLGNAKLSINYATDHLPVFHEIQIVSAQYWDAKYGSGNFSADVKAITAGVDFSATMKASIETACDATVGGGTGTALTAIPWNANWDAEVQSECQDAITASALATADALSTVDDFLDTEIATLVAELAKVPKSDGSSTWNATALAAIQSECNDALVAYDPPTKAELDTAQGAVTVAAISNNAITAAAINTGAIDADALAADAIAEIWDHAGAITSLGAELLLERIYEMLSNKMVVTESTGAVALRNIADGADIATGNVQDLGATTVRAGLTWV